VELDVQVIGISSDSPFALKTWADSLKVTFPLLSDRPPTVMSRYGVLAPDKVRALRAFFLVDKQGILRKQWLLGLAGDDIVFSNDPIFRAIQEIAGKR
jgi:peroxiredoxin